MIIKNITLKAIIILLFVNAIHSVHANYKISSCQPGMRYNSGFSPAISKRTEPKIMPKRVASFARKHPYWFALLVLTATSGAGYGAYRISDYWNKKEVKIQESLKESEDVLKDDQSILEKKYVSRAKKYVEPSKSLQKDQVEPISKEVFSNLFIFFENKEAYLIFAQKQNNQILIEKIKELIKNVSFEAIYSAIHGRSEREFFIGCQIAKLNWVNEKMQDSGFVLPEANIDEVYALYNKLMSIE